MTVFRLLSSKSSIIAAVPRSLINSAHFSGGNEQATNFLNSRIPKGECRESGSMSAIEMFRQLAIPLDTHEGSA